VVLSKLVQSHTSSAGHVLWFLCGLAVSAVVGRKCRHAMETAAPCFPTLGLETFLFIIFYATYHSIKSLEWYLFGTDRNWPVWSKRAENHDICLLKFRRVPPFAFELAQSPRVLSE
jgi:hypothetical protein